MEARCKLLQEFKNLLLNKKSLTLILNLGGETQLNFLGNTLLAGWAQGEGLGGTSLAFFYIYIFYSLVLFGFLHHLCFTCFYFFLVGGKF